MQAAYDYEAAEEDELSLAEGENVAVYNEAEDWILIAKEENFGMVPANYLQEVTTKANLLLLRLKRKRLESQTKL